MRKEYDAMAEQAKLWWKFATDFAAQLEKADCSAADFWDFATRHAKGYEARLHLMAES